MQADWGTTTLASYAYTLGRAGNRTSVAELSGRTVVYGYDDLYRLTSETISNDPGAQNGAIGYVYDKVGNRKQMSSTVPAIPPGMFYYDANDRLTTDAYDANGNTTSSAGIQNEYDFENRLVRHGDVTIVYDGDGNRVAETAGGATTNYLVDIQNPTGYAQVLEELQGGAVVRSYSWGHWLLSQRQLLNDVWTTSFYGYDGHGSVRYLTNSAGAVTDTYDYDAFGNLISSTGTTPNNYLFAGEQYDPVLGLYYNRARYYDPQRIRFLSMDSFEGRGENPLSLHKYVYANDNPINVLDPSGHESIGELVTVGAIITTLAGMAFLAGCAPKQWDLELVWENHFNWHVDYPEIKWDTEATLTTGEILQIKREAFESFKQAFTGYPVNIGEGHRGSNTAYIVDGYSFSQQTGLSCGETLSGSHASTIYYECNMEQAQWASKSHERSPELIRTTGQ